VLFVNSGCLYLKWGFGWRSDKSNQIKCISIALRTSADISKCCTETQPKTPDSSIKNQKGGQYFSTALYLSFSRLLSKATYSQVSKPFRYGWSRELNPPSWQCKRHALLTEPGLQENMFLSQGLIFVWETAPICSASSPFEQVSDQ
jgi:hypothetical protein